MVGSVACGGAGGGDLEDASPRDSASDVDDASQDVSQAPEAAACDAGKIPCLAASANADCNVYVCDLSQCPPGCEPYS